MRAGRRHEERPVGRVTGGQDVTLLASRDAVVRADSSRSIVLVEGISDLIALDVLAERRGRDLHVERVVIVPTGGAHAMVHFLERFGPQGDDRRVLGLCDAGEEGVVRRALRHAGVGAARDRDELERIGFFVCVDDLESELIAASDQRVIEAVLDEAGDLASFRTFQKQPAWRGAPFGAQMRRWVRAGARRRLVYARLLTEALELDRVPRPLDAVLAATSTH